MVQFTSKAQTLIDLKKNINTAEVLPLKLVSYSDFKQQKKKVADEIAKEFSQKKLVIRSTAKNEDSHSNSNAGHYKSFLGIDAANSAAVIEAIEKVFESYGNAEGEDVFVQPQLTGVTMAGVAFTADLENSAPYYIINYDLSGSTDSVTSGHGKNLKTFVHFKQAKVVDANPKLSMLIRTLQELEVLFATGGLDVEFAFDSQDKLYVFQVRPIVGYKEDKNFTSKLSDGLEKLNQRLLQLDRRHPNLLGRKTVYGVMPDWNPAEIIGIKPRQLALSLYKELVTDNIWAYQRDNYGYRNLRSHPLLISFLGMPYIDVRVDFNSFIPKSLSESIAEKLVNYYLDKLIQTPSHHDKVEFEIVHSCFYLNLPKRLKELLQHGFSEAEVKRIEYSLLDLTNKIANPKFGLYCDDLKKIETFKLKHERIMKSELSTIDKIYWLIEDCKRYGTLPFAGVARSAFVAVQFLISMKETGIITESDYDAFMTSLKTVSKQFALDIGQYSSGKISKEDLIKTYGHLRPGTYDILSERYDENFAKYFVSNQTNHQHATDFVFSADQMHKIEHYLQENGVTTTAEQLIQFIKEAIEGREYAKFVFTRGVSDVLTLLEQIGSEYGFSRDQVSHLDIQDLLKHYATIDWVHFKDFMAQNTQKYKAQYEANASIKLPSLIVQASDVKSFHLEEDSPTFITHKRIEATVVHESNFSNESLNGKVAFIKAADPGYDFLFSHNISALITQYGGANSHMAIRCAELGIPAVIGAGEKNFQSWKRAKIIQIDGANRQVRVIQ